MTATAVVPQPRTEDGPPPAIVFDHATLAYGSATVLHDVHGTVPAGQATALVGPNGAGKSTLIKAALGLVTVASGSVTVRGQRPAAARSRTAYVPQADTLDPEFPVTVGQVVLMGRYRAAGWLRRPGKRDRAIAADALDLVGLADRARDRFGTLSGGQRQRVLLARAIAQQADVLLLDEPFNGVDAISRDALLGALRELLAGGAAVLVSTHDLSVAHALCRQVCLLNGRQYGFGPPERTLTADNLRCCYGAHVLEVDGSTIVAGL
ncbi:metal ABC transporter ATP-binding protein [Streptomyces sp. PSKA54]|uniref:Metal ABC transporter ATP-binding protein n=1 Tax=Streptomyces himalayensis subsp. aureolus TaxID=2758039 RepID=A0A7W2HHJ5_9ACTN|nr:metal ABC transporter ATP-binding protein [Streptomyces himalayensis]MBA4864090.1 metal ABC transporter ATP-binding protein [Streptomyces himalayensis subsp. aureolus]